MTPCLQIQEGIESYHFMSRGKKWWIWCSKTLNCNCFSILPELIRDIFVKIKNIIKQNFKKRSFPTAYRKVILLVWLSHILEFASHSFILYCPWKLPYSNPQLSYWYFSEKKKETFDLWNSKIFALLTKDLIPTSLGIPIQKYFHISSSVDQISGFLNTFDSSCVLKPSLVLQSE